MSLFGFFKSTKQKSFQTDDSTWLAVASKITGLIWHTLQTEPKMIANQYARILLDDKWNISISNTQCAAEKILSDHDVAFAFLRENQSAYNKWISGLKSGNPIFQKIETEEFAKILTSTLKSQVDVIN